MPLSNWIYVITAVSILFNLMGLWGRFHLWRIDAHRVKAEERLQALFRPDITPAEIARLAPAPEHRTPGHRAEVTGLIATLEALQATAGSSRCRQRTWARRCPTVTRSTSCRSFSMPSATFGPGSMSRLREWTSTPRLVQDTLLNHGRKCRHVVPNSVRHSLC